MWGTADSAAVSKCPFLSELAAKHGEEYALNVAMNPHEQISPGTGRPLLEDGDNLASTVSLFHGHNGVLPLPGLFDQDQSDTSAETLEHNSARNNEQASMQPDFLRYALARAPLAAISISSPGMPGPGDWRRGQGSSRRNNSSSNQPKGRPSMYFSAAVGSTGLSATGACPLRKWLGPLAPVVFNTMGNLKCPDVIVQMRAALSRTEPVRQLRVQALPLKFVAVGATAALLNIPFGALREQYDKFSPGWFLAVHATIPFIAMLRKAVLMPKIAIICTIAAAIAGQAIGARMMRARTRSLQDAEDAGAADYTVAQTVAAGLTAAPTLLKRQACMEESRKDSRLRAQMHGVLTSLSETMMRSPAHTIHIGPETIALMAAVVGKV